MNRLKNAIKKLSWKPYSRLRGKNVSQTREQTITHLLWFYLFSVSLAFLSAVIQIWGIPAKWGISGAAKDLLSPLSAAIAVKLSYDFIRDIIATEFDAAIKNIEGEVKDRLLEEQKIREQTDDSSIKQFLRSRVGIAHSSNSNGASVSAISYIIKFIRSGFSIESINPIED